MRVLGSRGEPGNGGTTQVAPSGVRTRCLRARNFMNLITEFFRCNYEILLAESGIFISFSLKYFCL